MDAIENNVHIDFDSNNNNNNQSYVPIAIEITPAIHVNLCDSIPHEINNADEHHVIQPLQIRHRRSNAMGILGIIFCILCFFFFPFLGIPLIFKAIS